ncbi:MAG: VOC family protein [Bacteroidota bacterium]
MATLNGIHHLAISTNNMKEQIAFFSEVLEMELVALYWMHGTKGCWHGFMKLNDQCSLAFVFHPKNANGQVQLGTTHAAHGAGESAPGTMQHVSFNVETDEELLYMRDRIRSKGVNVMGPIEHGMCKSLYFAGPENLVLEIASSEQPINPKAWIDPEVVALAGISEEELARYKSPTKYNGEKGLKQPPYDPVKPHLAYPEKVYKNLLATPDEILIERGSHTEPPVAVD